MAQMNADMLTNVATRLVETRTIHLSPAERGEVLRIAQGYACKDSAAAAGVCYETIRARRKRIYRKLGVSGASEVISSLLLLALEMLASSGATAAQGAGDGARAPGAVSAAAGAPPELNVV